MVKMQTGSQLLQFDFNEMVLKTEPLRMSRSQGDTGYDIKEHLFVHVQHFEWGKSPNTWA